MCKMSWKLPYDNDTMVEFNILLPEIFSCRKSSRSVLNFFVWYHRTRFDYPVEMRLKDEELKSIISYLKPVTYDSPIQLMYDMSALSNFKEFQRYATERTRFMQLCISDFCEFENIKGEDWFAMDIYDEL